ncbi:MAG: carbohydrate porin [Phycisphaeraceae bacterium]
MRIHTIVRSAYILTAAVGCCMTNTYAGEALISHSDNAMAAVEDRHELHSPRPDVQRPQQAQPSNDRNVDTGYPPRTMAARHGRLGGLRPSLDDRGIILEASLTTDWSNNLRGGMNTEGSTFRHLFNANITLDTERLFDWEGGTVFVNFQNHNGPDGSADDVGDAQAFSNIDADGRTEIAELWFEQILGDGVVRVKVGKVEANAEYAYAENAAEFINSSMGFSPTIFVLPTYPDPATSVNVFIYPKENIYVGAGVFDGSLQEGVPTGLRGPRTFFHDPADLFVIAETGVSWDYQGNPGRLAIGGWWHTGTFTRFDGMTDEETGGFYLVLDQTLWQADPDNPESTRSVSVFFQYGYADEDVSMIEHHAGAGLAWNGPIDGRDDDVLGLGISAVWFSDEPGAGFTDDTEVACELFYKAQLLPWLSLKPDLQYITNPGGVGLDDATVATLRIDVLF